jgi:cobalt-zinc-cadmium efflux system outer membrane protein
MRVSASIAWVFALACPAIFCGCATPDVDVPTHPHSYPLLAGPGTTQRTIAPPDRLVDKTPVRQASASDPAPAPIPAALDLDALLALARQKNPDLAAAAARVEEARGRMIQAGLYPNPTVGYAGNQINDGPGTPGQQGGFISQEFVTGGKLRIAREAARFGVTAADWHAASKWFDTQARVKAAYYEYAAATSVLRETERMETLFKEALVRTERLAAGGRVDGYDVSRLKVEVVQIANRVGAARQRQAAAERMLAVAVGVDRLDGTAKTGDLEDAVSAPSFDEAVSAAGRSSFVLAAAAEAEQARLEVRAAEVRPIPNVHTTTTVAHDYVTRAPMASVMVGLAIPVWDRNQGSIAASAARLAAALAAVEQTRLRQIERLTAAYQKYENARRQLDLYRTKVLPDAETALTQIDRVYALKGERFLDTLDARRVLTLARIDYAQALGDLRAALAEIEAVTQIAR